MIHEMLCLASSSFDLLKKSLSWERRTDRLMEMRWCILRFALFSLGPRDGRTDGLTNRRTDRPSFRDARTCVSKTQHPTCVHNLSLSGCSGFGGNIKSFKTWPTCKVEKFRCYIRMNTSRIWVFFSVKILFISFSKLYYTSSTCFIILFNEILFNWRKRYGRTDGEATDGPTDGHAPYRDII